MNLISLHPRQPFSFHWSSIIFEHHDSSVRVYANRVFTLAASLSTGPVILTVEQKDEDVNSPLVLSIHSDEPVLPGMTSEASAVISRVFALDEDLTEFYLAIGGDPVMAGLARRFYGLHSPATPTVFEALVDSVIEQQISLSVARGLEYRFIRRYGQSFTVKNQEYFCYPTPDQLASVPIEGYRECGLTIRKGEYIRNIAQKILDGGLDLEVLKEYSDPEEIIDLLCEIRGIGRWTAELTMLRGLHRMDAFPADDIALRRIISRWYYGGRKISGSEAMEIAERWENWKGLASFYLEISEHCGVAPESLSQV